MSKQVWTECPACQYREPFKRPLLACPACGGEWLDAAYDYDFLKDNWYQTLRPALYPVALLGSVASPGQSQYPDHG